MSQIWSPQQEEALRGTAHWMKDPHGSQVYYVAGYAGTGKTTLAKTLVGDSGENWLFAAYTGKASYILRQKGCTNARTIHSLIYRPNGTKSDQRVTELEFRVARARDSEQKALAARPSIPEDSEPNTTDDGVNFRKMSAQLKRDKECGLYVVQMELKSIEEELRIAKLNEKRRPAFQLWDESPLREADGIVVDECSMVDEEVGTDLLSFGKKVLVLGDPAQLPPVGASGFFTNRTPDHLLTEVHRQARESGILDLATFVREGGDVRSRVDERWTSHDCEVRMVGDFPDMRQRVLDADQVIVGLNATRRKFNRRHRELLGRTSPLPVEGDRVISLVNDRGAGLLNGSMWRVNNAIADDEDDTVGLELTSEDGEQRTAVSAWSHHFLGREEELKAKGWNKRDNAEMTYGYAITGHKSQGSQWGSVVVFDESRAFKGAAMQRSWLYTCITRASRKLVVIV